MTKNKQRENCIVKGMQKRINLRFLSLFLFIMMLFIFSVTQNSFADEIQYQLKSGWNKISFPFSNVTSLGDTTHISSWMCHFKTDEYLYEWVFVNNPGGIQPGDGYWVKADQDTTLTVTGTLSSAANTPVTVGTGWTQFGLPYYCSELWGDVTVSYGSDYNVTYAISQGWFANMIAWYNPDTASYDFSYAASTIDPQKGFWLKSTIDGSLVFDLPDKGMVKGTVTEQGTSNPLPAVTVAIGAVQDTTNAQGEYTLTEAPAGSQTITATLAAYYDYSASVNVVGGGIVTHNISMVKVVVPVLNSISPVAGGPRTIITLSGSEFGDGTNSSVSINGVQVPSGNVRSWTATQIEILAPDGISTGNVVVTKHGVSNVETNNFEVYTQGLQGYVQDMNGNPITDGDVHFEVRRADDGTVITNSVSIADANGSFKIYMPATAYNLEVRTTHTGDYFIQGMGTVAADTWEYPQTTGNIIKAFDPNGYPPWPWEF